MTASRADWLSTPLQFVKGVGPRRAADLERVGLLDAEWRETENGRRGRFYSLTRAGRKQLNIETTAWDRRVAAINRLLRTEA